jgi:protein-L-isoaspartate(D-aspartate) O-methyltransferase
VASSAISHLINQLVREGIPRGPILDAIAAIPRDRFVPHGREAEAWGNYPIPIGHGQTISQPYTVARMLLLADLAPGRCVLEVGSGCGYVLALAAAIVGGDGAVYGVERVAALARRSRTTLDDLDLPLAIRVRTGDGREGWREHAPYDAVIVSAQSPDVPPALVDQLASGGSLVIPVDVGGVAVMTRVRKSEDALRTTEHGSYSFVPLR